MLSFIHRFEPGDRAGRAAAAAAARHRRRRERPLPLGRAVAPGSALLSPRGKVLENGMPRFFRRLAEGVFDEDDLRRRADELAGFIAEARAAYGLAAPMALGFSNGANIAAALLLLRPEALAGAVLLRAMVPLAEPPKRRPRRQAGADPLGRGRPDRPGRQRRPARGAARGRRRRRSRTRRAGRPRAVAGRRHDREGVAGGAEKIGVIPGLAAGENPEPMAGWIVGACPVGSGFSASREPRNDRREALDVVGSTRSSASRKPRRRAPGR